MENRQDSEENPHTSSEADKSPASSANRPTTLNILLGNSTKSPILPSFRTPTLEDLTPILKSEVEKLLKQWKASPQTPGTFLNPKNVTDEQERFANAFTQKLNELQDANCLASITAAMSPAGVCSNNLYNVSLPELTAQNLPNFAELCRQAVQQQQQQQPGISNPPILLYSPANIPSQTLNASQSKPVTVTNSQLTSTLDSLKNASDLCNLKNNLQGAVSITLPTSALSVPNKEFPTLQLANGLKFEITTNCGMSQASVLKMLGIDSTATDVNRGTNPDVKQLTDPLLWPLQVQTPASNDTTQLDGQLNNILASPRDENDTRPSSVSNSLDQMEIGRPVRSSSSISSNSSISHSNGKDNVTSSNFTDTRLDPTEQYRMRLERKRARNRDAARKCRERKIRLIKSLEKDVFHLSEENKTLRNRLSRSRNEVERLKLFVVNHLEKECSAISNKVV